MNRHSVPQESMHHAPIRRPALLLIALLSLQPVGNTTEDDPGDSQGPTFPPREIISWEERTFEGRSHYALIEKDGVEAIRARCDDTASGLFVERTIDLNRTPVLEWRWRLDSLPNTNVDETSREGDDFALRVYVIVDGGWLPWRSRAISYVWTRNISPGTDWANPWVDQARMVSLRRGENRAGEWVTERRNLRDDFRAFHDMDATELDGLAIMTDCDNTGASAQAWYGALRFTTE